MRKKIFYLVFFWNLLLIIATSYISIFIPLDLVFNIENPLFEKFSNYVITLIFGFDIVVQLLLYKRGKDKESFVKTKSIKDYLRGWFIIDLIAFIPFGLIFPLSIINLARLIKLARVYRFMADWRERDIIHAHYLQLIFFAFWIALSTHWICCGWMALQEDTVPNVSRTEYIESLYWCVTTLSTVGYGDITPKNNSQTLYAIFVMLTGAGFYGYLIGKVASMLSKKDPAKTRYLENMEKLSVLGHYRHIPLELQNRIREYHLYMWKNRLGYNESNLLDGLPDGIKTEVSLILKKEVIEKVPLLNEAGQEFIKEIALHLRPKVLTPEEVVFYKGDEGKEMFFVVKGTLEVLSVDSQKVISTLTDGDFFGEIALFLNKSRTATVRAITYCDLYYLSKSTFDRIVSNYPAIAAEIEAKIKLRAGELKY